MQPDFKRFATALSALLAVSVSASAQEISTSLPLTTVGDRLTWSVGDQDLTLNVPLDGPVRLELYSPRLDQSDYRSDTYYGDEQYDANRSDVTTTFTLIGEDGAAVLTRTFTPGAHDWETLLDQTLPAGRYRLKAVTQGNGKNTFAVRLAGISASVSADRLNVNVHSQDWVPAVNVSTDGQAHVLRMYDGDGPQELQARLRDGQGNVTPLTVSADLAFTDLTLPAQAGNYTVELRQPPTARQFSNTVGFSLTRAGVPEPITISRVDQTGLLRVTAELILPGGAQPTAASAIVGKTPVTVDGIFAQRVAPGQYAVVPDPVPGADVSVDTGSVTVPKNGEGEAHIKIRPTVALTLSSDKPDVCVGDTVTLTARASTAYAGDLPLDLSLDTAGLNVQGLNSVQGTLSAARPGELRLTGTATQSGPLTVTARLAPWAQEQSVTLNVRPDVTTLQLSRDPLSDATVGDEITVTLRVTNTGTRAAPYLLADMVPAGLEALSAAQFSGTLQPGETRELSYRARVTAAGTQSMQAHLRTPDCAATQTVSGALTAQPVPVAAPAPAPEQRRASTVTLPFDAPRQATELIVAHSVPETATLVPGSSRLDGQPIPDPVRGPSGTLYWVLPEPSSSPATAGGAALRGAVTYDLAHAGPLAELPAPALLARYRGGRSENLEGRVDLADLSAARSVTAATAVTENPGAIKYPLDGSQIRIRDRISVVVEVPATQDASLRVNGAVMPDSSVGEVVSDPERGTRRVTYVGVPLKPGPNALNVGADSIQVQLVGATTHVEVTPGEMTADGSTPLRVHFRALDAHGNLTTQSTLTLRSNLEPQTPDQNPTEADYQIALVDGEGDLILHPQASPTTLKLGVLVGQDIKPYSFEVKPDSSRVGVGVVSATLGLDGSLSLADDLTWTARASYEGPLAGGKLYVAADKDGLPTNRDTLKRFSVYGDSSTESVPLQGIDPVALSYDHPTLRAEYRQTSLPIDVLPVGEQLTALTVTSKSNPQVSAFAALVPEDRVSDERVTPEGTRLLRLANGDIAQGSETLEVLTTERDTGKELRRVTLQRNVDYILDHRTGIITLARALDTTDAQLNTVTVLASYRLNNPLAQRKAAFGAQVKYTGRNYTVGAAAISLDQTVTTGARATYDNGTTRADGLLAYSGGMQGSADLSTTLGQHAIQARIRYQDGQYDGLAPFSPGLTTSASVDSRLTRNLSSSVQAEYHNTLGTTDTDTSGGSVTGRADYRLAPFSVGAGLKYAFGDQYGVGAVLSAGYHQKPIDVDVVHTQPLTGNLDTTTTITTRYAVTDTVSIGLSDQINWKTGHTASLNLESRLGNTNYQVAYDLPNAGGQGNRARFGVSTTLPLTDRLTAGLRGSATYDISAAQTNLGAGADLRYATDRVNATLGTDLTYTTKGFGVVLRSGVSGSLSEHLSLTADGLMEFGAGKNGQRAALGYAYRNRTFNSLGTVRYVNGTLAGNQPELSSNFAAEYRQPTWAVRAGLDTRTLLNDPGSFTAQFGASSTYYVTDRIGIGAWGRAITQPASQNTQYGYGLEASVRALPGTWITAGYNPAGFTGLGNTYTKQGAYLRLDLTIDETLGQNK
ncbi:hypothetical protein GCM10008959_33750 [Deinococcus seoulensis]|uniref:DUF11 domain-containing protein n=1 Tax=Deinococcus seoulensis TaxID=1837379 RepID=A0ABQ2RWQ3_9DEIO|nr:DUF11 domain-containing protein [Deinococcus seoulensis]GGR68940.1 hypothetical protein GCM10008959_33750 [Deinococcus seoulensis]